MTIPPGPDPTRALLEKATLELRRLRAENRSLAARRAEPIAIVGMACRFPGGASPAELWRFLEAGGDAISEISPQRWPADATTADAAGARWAGLLPGDLAGFDAEFFGIAPREAISLDPQQRLLLEVSWEALEHAGCAPARLAGTRTGVYVGMSNLDYQDLVKAQRLDQLDAYAATGNLHSTAAGRIAYTLDLQGPCLTVDTACSSSLVAVHLACRALREEDCELALAGGVHLLLSPLTMQLVARTQGLAPDGRCKPFDARADGFVRAEGCGVVVLKRLADARRDGDRVLAVIRGSAVNQDGHSAGLTAPNVLAQQALLAQALADARVSAPQIDLVEAHGTGTALGDPIEVEALSAVFGGPRPDGPPCLLGSVKANLGHLEAAAGIAGLIKVVLALEHEAVAPQINLRTLNPRIRIDHSPFEIATAARRWPRSARPRLAGVSSFGISGTNAHVIVEEAPAEERGAARDVTTGEPVVLPLSAKSPDALRALGAAWCAALGDAAQLAAAPVQDVAYTASVRRSHHPYRLAVVGATPGELGRALAAALASPGAAGSRDDAGDAAAARLVFVFPGQGSQWVGMGRRLIATEPVFAAAIDACERAMRDHVAWSLRAELDADAERSRFGEIDVLQPILWALQVALAALWRAWGVEPDVVIGHSMGEVAAACHAGILTLEAGARVICRRSQLMRRLSGRGAMALVELDAAQAADAVRARPGLAIAAYNGPRATVISGDAGELDGLLAELERRAIFARKVKVDVASHSPEVDGVLAELRGELAGLRAGRAERAMRSTVRGGRVDGPDLDAAYWVANLREPVRFADAVAAELADRPAHFLEISPHPVLLPSLGEILAAAGARGELVGSLRRDEDDAVAIRHAAGALYVAGRSIAWDRLIAGPRPPVTTPSYPWQRARYRVDTSDRPARLAAAGVGAASPAGRCHEVATLPATRVFERELALASSPWLAEHRVGGRAVMPGAGHLALALAAAREIGPDLAPPGLAVEALVFEQLLEITDAAPRRVQVVIDASAPGRLRFEILSRRAAAQAGDDSWLRHARGVLRRPALDDVGASAAEPGGDPAAVDEIQGRCRPVDPELHYRRMAAMGIEYGPRFRGVQALWRGAGEALGVVREVVAPAGVAAHPGDAAAGALSATQLDACFQVIAAAISERDGDRRMLPVGVEYLAVRTPLPGAVTCHARLRERRGELVIADLTIGDELGREIGIVRGFALRSIDVAAARQPPWSYEIHWRPAPLGPAAVRAPGQIAIVGDPSPMAEALRARLEACGHRCTVVPELELAGRAAPPDAVVHLHALAARPTAALETGATGPDAIGEDVRRGVETALRTVQVIAQAGLRNPPRLYLVTRGAEPAASAGLAAAVAQAAVWGFGRTAMHEHPELRPTLFDLDPEELAGSLAALADEVQADDVEDQLAIRGGVRVVARLVQGQAGDEPSAPAGDRSFGLEIARPGVLDHLALRARPPAAPGLGQVAIEVEAVGLNFLDVLLALGVIPDDASDAGGPPLGRECAGRVIAVGPGVTAFAPGQPVVALAERCLARHAVADQRLVVARPPGLDAASAASLPLAFLTAVRALEDVARLRPGERVLIHAAAGGVGLAAIQVARRAGAEVFATAGTEDKRAFLRALGIAHVASSRDPRFADAIRAATGGEGVDVVLNSLAGEMVEASLQLLRADGRFVEIGKRDYLDDRPIRLGALLRRLSIALVDLRGETIEHPGRVGALLARVVERVGAGELAPLPVRVVAIAAAHEAFHAMARGEHIGKLVVALADAERAPIRPARLPAARLRADRTYLITGGTGGIGLRLARWLVDGGARHVALLGRAPEAAGAGAELSALRAAGAEVRVVRGDAALRDDVARAVADIDRGGAPLGGVIHAAGVLEDGAIAKQDYAAFARVMAPKVAGAWNLHQVVGDRPLDLFVLCSSAAALLGSPGQAGYAAANAVLDALAHYRRARGLAGLAIDWGAWTEVGLAARAANRGARLAAHGLDGLSPDDNIAALSRVVADGAAQRAVMMLNVRQWREVHLATARAPLLSELVSAADAAGSPGDRGAVRGALEALPPERRRPALRDHVRAEVARVLRCDPARIGDASPLQQTGLDSLMAMELRNRLESGLGIGLTVTVIWRHPTVHDLADYIAGELGWPAAPAVVGDKLARLFRTLEKLSGDPPA